MRRTCIFVLSLLFICPTGCASRTLGNAAEPALAPYSDAESAGAASSDSISSTPDDERTAPPSASVPGGKETEESESAAGSAAREIIYQNVIADNEEALNKALDTVCERYAVTGMSIAAFEHEKIVYTHSFGTANREVGVPASENTRYRTASIAKMVTTVIALMLQRQSVFNLDDDLRGIMPLLKDPFFPDEPITARELIMHTSGLMDGEGYVKAINGDSFPRLADVFSGGNNWTKKKPGSNYEYSNFGAGLISGVTEHFTDKRFFDYAKDILFDPMQIDAAYSVSLIKDRQSIASMYSGDVMLAAPSTWNNMSAVYAHIPLGELYLTAQGDLFITAEDLAKIGMILAGDGTYAGNAYLRKEDLAEMNSVALKVDDEDLRRGLGTFVFSGVAAEADVYGHQGNAYNSLSFLLYEPKSRTGVAFLTNGCYDTKGDEGLYHINREIATEVWRYLTPAA